MKAFARGLASAFLALFVSGCSLKKDLQACEKGKLDACKKTCELGVLDEFGCLGAASAMTTLGYQQRRSVEKEVLHFYELSCRGGHLDGCLDAASSLERRAGSESLEEYRAFLEAACELAGRDDSYEWTRFGVGVEPSRVVACSALGRSYLLEDDDRAQRAFLRACEFEPPISGCKAEMQNYLSASQSLLDKCEAQEKAPHPGGTNPCQDLRQLVDPIRRGSIGDLSEFLAILKKRPAR